MGHDKTSDADPVELNGETAGAEKMEVDGESAAPEKVKAKGKRDRKSPKASKKSKKKKKSKHKSKDRPKSKRRKENLKEPESDTAKATPDGETNGAAKKGDDGDDADQDEKTKEKADSKEAGAKKDAPAPMEEEEEAPAEDDAASPKGKEEEEASSKSEKGKKKDSKEGSSSSRRDRDRSGRSDKDRRDRKDRSRSRDRRDRRRKDSGHRRSRDYERRARDDRERDDRRRRERQWRERERERERSNRNRSHRDSRDSGRGRRSGRSRSRGRSDRYRRKRRRRSSGSDSSSSDSSSESSSSSSSSSDSDDDGQAKSSAWDAAPTNVSQLMMQALANAAQPGGAAMAGPGATGSVQQLMAKVQMLTQSVPNATATKPQRELYVGNLPQGIMGPQLQEILNKTILEAGLNMTPGAPIVNTWISSDAHYAFIEFRTIDECNNGLLLNNLPLLGQQLRVGRPKSYAGIAAMPTQLSLANFIQKGGAAKLAQLGATGVQGLNIPGMTGAPAAVMPGMAMPGMAMPGMIPGMMPGMMPGMTGMPGMAAVNPLQALLARANATMVGATPGANPGLLQLQRMRMMQQMGMPMTAAGQVGMGGAMPVPVAAAPVVPVPQVKLPSNELVAINIPEFLNQEQVKQLLEPFSEIKTFELLNDEEGNSRGVARFEYADVSVNAKAIKGLSGIPVGDKNLKVMKLAAAQEKGIIEKEPEPEPVVPEPVPEAAATPVPAVPQAAEPEPEPTTCLELSNMVTKEDLTNDEEYEDIKLDVGEECAKGGKVLAVEIPRVGVGAGKIFVQFEDTAGAIKSRKELTGRNFGDRTVMVAFFPPEAFAQKEWGAVAAAAEAAAAAAAAAATAETETETSGSAGQAAAEAEVPTIVTTAAPAAAAAAVSGLRAALGMTAAAEPSISAID